MLLKEKVIKHSGQHAPVPTCLKHVQIYDVCILTKNPIKYLVFVLDSTKYRFITSQLFWNWGCTFVIKPVAVSVIVENLSLLTVTNINHHKLGAELKLWL